MRHHHLFHTDTDVRPIADGIPRQVHFDHLVCGWKLHGSLFHHTNAPDQTSAKRWRQFHAPSLGRDRNEHRRELLLKLTNAADEEES